MPNTPVPAAAPGLPIARSQCAAIMRRAHAEARAAASRRPYADRFRFALRRAWRDSRFVACTVYPNFASCGATFQLSEGDVRQVLGEEIERLIAILDALDGDPDLEPSLGSYDASRYALDSEADCEDEGAQCDDEGFDSDREPSWGWSNPLGAKVDRRGVLIVENVADRQVRL